MRKVKINSITHSLQIHVNFFWFILNQVTIMNHMGNSLLKIHILKFLIKNLLYLKNALQFTLVLGVSLVN
jgi:hypothetical protein